MKRALVPCVAAALLCGLAISACRGETVAEDTAATPAAPTDMLAALQADRNWSAALDTNDAAAAGALLDAEFQWTDAQGRTRSTAETLDDLPALAGDFRDETDRQTFHYGRVHVITSGRPGARMMRVWTMRPEGWRLFALIGTELVTGTTPFAATGGAGTADCDNPCRTMPFMPQTENEKTIAAIFQRLKVDEWHPNPDDWAPYVLDDVYYVTATAQLSKDDRVAHLARLKETGAPSVPGDPVVSMRIHDFGDSAVMIARHNPYRGGKPYLSVRVWALRGGRWQLANTQQTVMADAPAVPPA